MRRLGAVLVFALLGGCAAVPEVSALKANLAQCHVVSGSAVVAAKPPCGPRTQPVDPTFGASAIWIAPGMRLVVDSNEVANIGTNATAPVPQQFVWQHRERESGSALTGFSQRDAIFATALVAASANSTIDAHSCYKHVNGQQALLSRMLGSVTVAYINEFNALGETSEIEKLFEGTLTTAARSINTAWESNATAWPSGMASCAAPILESFAPASHTQLGLSDLSDALCAQQPSGNSRLNLDSAYGCPGTTSIKKSTQPKVHFRPEIPFQIAGENSVRFVPFWTTIAGLERMVGPGRSVYRIERESKHLFGPENERDMAAEVIGGRFVMGFDKEALLSVGRVSYYVPASRKGSLLLAPGDLVLLR